MTRSTIVVLSTWTMDWLIVTTARAATKPVPGEDTLGRDRLTPGHANGCIPCASCIQGGLYLHSIWTWHVKKSARHIKRCGVRTRMYGVVWPASRMMRNMSKTYEALVIRCHSSLICDVAHGIHTQRTWYLQRILNQQMATCISGTLV